MDDAALVGLAEYHNDVVSSLKLYFGQFQVASADFRIQLQIEQTLTARLKETDERSAFFVLAQLEVVFRSDYKSRCRTKLKDGLSKTFKEIWKLRGERVSLDQDIFEAWRGHLSDEPRRLISDLRGAFRFRHWVAHGRSGEPRLGRKYDFTYIYSLADDILSSFPFQRTA